MSLVDEKSVGSPRTDHTPILSQRPNTPKNSAHDDVDDGPNIIVNNYWKDYTFNPPIFPWR